MPMTYEELLAALAIEETRIVNEFNANAQVADFIKLKGEVGLLIKHIDGSFMFLRLSIGSAESLSNEDIIKLKNWGDDYAKVGLFFQEKAQAISDRNNPPTQ
jgi:hypothetical protein